tara:strand:+ start:484 stop:624 length:141 start_codon:yes stop_codon:yes gene_type:complete
MRRKGFGSVEIRKSTKKKTRQGHGKRTKYGNKLSKKYYKKRKKGQG